MKPLNPGFARLAPALSLLLAHVLPLGAAERTFTSSDGKTMEAEILDATAETVTLKRKSDDKEFTVPLERFSQDDRDHVAGWRANNRAAREVTLTTTETEIATYQVPAGPMLDDDGTLNLYVGDVIHLEFPEGNAKDVKPMVVAQVVRPDRTLTLKLTNEKGMTMLNRTTGIQETIGMKCNNRSYATEEYIRTNIIPTEKGQTGFDSWPGDVVTVKLTAFEVSDEPAAKVYDRMLAE